MALSLFAARTLTATVLVIHPTDNFLTQTFYGKEIPVETKHVDIVITKGGKEIAPFVAPSLSGKVVKSKGKTLKTFEPPLLKPKFVTEAESLLKDNNTFTGLPKTPEERAADKLAEDLDDGKQRIYRSIEWMVAQSLTLGSIDVKGDGVEENIDFGRESNLTKVLTGSNLWSDPSSDPRADLGKWKEEVLDASGVDPDICVMGRDVGNTYMKHPKVVDAFDKKDISRGEMRPEKKMEGVTYLGYDRELDLQIYKYVGKFTNPDTKVDTPYLPVDKLILGSSHERTQAHIAFGAISDFDAFEEEELPGQFFEGQIFAKSWRQKDPSVRFVLLQSKPLPIPGNVDASMCAKVV